MNQTNPATYAASPIGNKKECDFIGFVRHSCMSDGTELGRGYASLTVQNLWKTGFYKEKENAIIRAHEDIVRLRNFFGSAGNKKRNKLNPYVLNRFAFISIRGMNPIILCFQNNPHKQFLRFMKKQSKQQLEDLYESDTPDLLVMKRPDIKKAHINFDIRPSDGRTVSNESLVIDQAYKVREYDDEDIKSIKAYLRWD